MKYYYAEFKDNDGQVEVEFPDLPGCVTFGEDWEEAYDNAIDVLAGWLAHAEIQFIKKPSQHEKLINSQGELIPIPVDEKIIQHYQISKIHEEQTGGYPINNRSMEKRKMVYCQLS
jgi:predicted RNase H-like HicB family nuclease